MPIQLPSPNRVQELVVLDISGDDEASEAWNPEAQTFAYVELLLRQEDEQCVTYRLRCDKQECLVALNRILAFWREGVLYYSQERSLYVVPFVKDAAVHRRIAFSVPPKNEG